MPDSDIQHYACHNAFSELLTSKVCYVHLVLSALYQEKMVTEQEVENLKNSAECPWHHLVHIQGAKPPDVVKRTAELLAEVGHSKEGRHLKGQ